MRIALIWCVYFRYNNYSPYGLKGLLSDRVNRMMSYAVLRQVRVNPNTCRVNNALKGIIAECRAFSNIINEDRKSYRPEWTGAQHVSYVNESLPVSVRSGLLNPAKSHKDIWNYRSQSELYGLPFWGIISHFKSFLFKTYFI